MLNLAFKKTHINNLYNSESAYFVVGVYCTLCSLATVSLKTVNKTKALKFKTGTETKTLKIVLRDISRPKTQLLRTPSLGCS